MIGQKILHYKIIEKLGEGGMGVVYKAEDTKLKREVALKFLSPNAMAGDEEKVRFEHEAQAAAALDHPNICTVYEINKADGQVFIAMAYVDGKSLQDVVRKGPLSLPDALDYSTQISEGLQAAHEKGIVHRDIKPANILITEKGLVRITDFGLAKLAGRTQLTKEGTSMGTVAYMSPEQTQGIEVDHRTDIWALGAVIYEMITGQQPFLGDYEQAVMYSIMNEEPEPMTGLRTGVPIELERILNKALAKKPNERYQHVSEMLVDLKSLAKKFEPGMTKQPLIEKKPSTRRHKFLYGVVVFFFVLVLGGGIYFQLLREKESDESIAPNRKTETTSSSQWANSIAVLPFENISSDKEQEYFCDGMTEQIITNLSQIQNLKVIARTSVMKFKDTKKTIPEIAKELQVANVLEGSIRKAGNRIRVTAQLIQADGGHHLWANDYDRELQDIFAVQDDVAQAIVGALLEELTLDNAEKLKNKQTKNAEAYQYYLQGEFLHREYHFGTQREANFKKSEQVFKKAIALDPNYATAYAGLANLYNSYDNLNREESKYVNLQQKYIDTAFNLDPNSAYVNVVKSDVHSYVHEMDDQYESLKRALQINPNDRNSNNVMGIFLLSRGLHHQAIKYFTKSIELDPLGRSGSGWRGLAFALSGMFDQALMDYQHSIAKNPDGFIMLGVMAHHLIKLKKYDQAEEFVVKSKGINPNHLNNKLLDAYLCAAKGKKEEALQSLEQSNGESDKSDKLMIYSLLGMTEEALKLLAEKPYAGSTTGRHVELDYLDMLHNPYLDNIREMKEFQAALQKAKEIYEENLLKYAQVFL